MNKKQKKLLYRIIAAVVLVIALELAPVDGWLKFALYLIPYLIIGYETLVKAVKGIKNRQPFDENFLMAVATIGAIALGDFREGVSVIFLNPVDFERMGPALEAARAAHIPVVTIDTNVQDSDFVASTIETDNYAAGRACAEHLLPVSRRCAPGHSPWAW